jgi:threonine/homoserine/homoserine lactone efflux protein
VIGDLLAGAAAGLAVAMPVGAIGAYLLGLAARERFSVAAAAALGVGSVDGAYALIASLGGAGLRSLLQRTSTVLTVLAALVLAGLALRTLRQAVRRYRHVTLPVASPGRQASPLRAYAALVGLTAVNPATVITFSAVALGRPAGDAGLSWVASRSVRSSPQRPGSCSWSAGVPCLAGCWPAAAGSWASPSPRPCSCSPWPWWC